MVRCGTWVLSLLGLMVLGCGKGDELPHLYPVKGRILKKGQAVSRGQVKFSSPKDPTALLIKADVGKDGSFTLTTTKGSTTAPGAPAGVYQVLYQSGGDPGNLKDSARMKAFLPVTLTENCKVEPRESGNEFTFDLAKVKK
jgi:hypothetical protein